VRIAVWFLIVAGCSGGASSPPDGLDGLDDQELLFEETFEAPFSPPNWAVSASVEPSLGGNPAPSASFTRSSGELQQVESLVMFDQRGKRCVNPT
jgi:hypothetical protein